MLKNHILCRISFSFDFEILFVARALGPERTRDELIPFLIGLFMECETHDSINFIIK